MERTGEPQAKPLDALSCLACSLARVRGDSFCPKCGQRLEAEKPDPPKKKEPQNNSSPAAARVLPSPDGPTQEAELPRVPPAHETPARCMCGSSLTSDAKFCCSCGQPAGVPVTLHTLTYRAQDGREVRVSMQSGEAVIGKTDDCDLPLHSDGYVSRRHARVYETGDGIFVEDLGSANGTFLRVSTPRKLEPGDEIVVGKTVVSLNTTIS